MISFEEYKELCKKYNLHPCTRGGLINKDDAREYNLPFYRDEDYYNNVGGLIVTSYSKWGVRVAFDITSKNYKFGPYLVTIEQVEKALIELTKEVKEYKYKRMLEKIRADF